MTTMREVIIPFHFHQPPLSTSFPRLADSLVKSGCADHEILDHCRGPGPHVRGCWVSDLVLGKE